MAARHAGVRAAKEAAAFEGVSVVSAKAAACKQAATAAHNAVEHLRAEWTHLALQARGARDRCCDVERHVTELQAASKRRAAAKADLQASLASCRVKAELAAAAAKGSFESEKEAVAHEAEAQILAAAVTMEASTLHPPLTCKQ